MFSHNPTKNKMLNQMRLDRLDQLLCRLPMRIRDIVAVGVVPHALRTTAGEKNRQILVGDQDIAGGYFGGRQQAVVNELAEKLGFNAEFPGDLAEIAGDVIEDEFGFRRVVGGFHIYSRRF